MAALSSGSSRYTKAGGASSPGAGGGRKGRDVAGGNVAPWPLTRGRTIPSTPQVPGLPIPFLLSWLSSPGLWSRPTGPSWRPCGFTPALFMLLPQSQHLVRRPN